jgi:hypothetical protein
MIFSAVYLLARCLLRYLMVTAQREACKDAELLALRHQNAVLRRQISRVRYQPAGRLWLAAVPADPPPPVGRGLRRDSGAGALPWATSLFTATALASSPPHAARRFPPPVLPTRTDSTGTSGNQPPAYPHQRPQILAETRIGEYDAPPGPDGWTLIKHTAPMPASPRRHGLLWSSAAWPSVTATAPWAFVRVIRIAGRY